MRLLADENVPGAVVEVLRAAGCDVAWVRTDTPGASDPEVLARAVRELRTLVTFDKDFGELARQPGLPKACGVLLIRLPMPPPSEAGERLASIILSRRDWAGHFSVIEPGRVRMRPLEPG